MAHLDEDSAPTALFAASDATPALGFLEECNLFADDYMAFLFEDCAGFNKDLEMTALGYSALVKEDAQGSIAAAFELPSVESFGAFDLELDLTLAPTRTRQYLDPGAFEMSSGSATLPPAKTQLDVDECELRQPTKKKRRKTVNTSKHSSQRQREEIQSLRATAARLEQDLKRMRTVGSQQNAPIMIESMELSVGGNEATVKQVLLWECVAKRQEEAKQRAERENAELRNVLQSKIKVAKSFEQQLLRKRKLREL